LLRVCPKSLGGIAEFSKHEADGSELEEGKGVAVEVLPVLGQAAAAIEPGDGALDNPAAGEGDETGEAIRSFDDLSFEMRQDGGQGSMKDWSLVGAVGEQLG